MQPLSPRILGTGFAVPRNLRANDDPIFDWLRAHPTPSDPFHGYNTRVVLGPGEDLMTLMVPAALNAIQDAGLQPSDIDMLIGNASISPFETPNELSRLHQMLDLPSRTYTVALNNDFSTFNAGLLFADALVRTQRAKNILIVVGTNWTRHVSYRTIQSVSAADGAGAAVVGPSTSECRWEVVDQHVVMETKYFGSMLMQGKRIDPPSTRDGNEPMWSSPYFQITADGLKGFGDVGKTVAIATVLELLERNRIQPGEITLIAHQASSVLLDAWKDAIQPAQLIHTIDRFANMTAANVPVNLAWSVHHQPITQNHLVLLALGPDMHAHALLLRRNSAL